MAGLMIDDAWYLVLAKALASGEGYRRARWTTGGTSASTTWSRSNPWPCLPSLSATESAMNIGGFGWSNSREQDCTVPHRTCGVLTIPVIRD